jgi:hypothetical protein
MASEMALINEKLTNMQHFALVLLFESDNQPAIERRDNKLNRQIGQSVSLPLLNIY